MNDEPEVEVEIILEEDMPEETLEPIDTSVVEDATGIHVITIVYDDHDPSAPQLHLGGTSPWLAYSILSAAVDTIAMVRPPLSVTYDGNTIFSSEFFEEE